MTAITVLADRIDAILPQTQCTQCGYDGCRPYADALARGEAGINQCPPGGESGIQALATLLNQPYQPLHPGHGLIRPKMVAIIDETTCIGCTLCIKACPVDAILGAHKQMHTVIAAECTGCELCMAPCPVNCINMQPLANQDWDYTQPASLARQVADRARARYQRRLQRMDHILPKRSLAATCLEAEQPSVANVEARKAALVAAIARVRAQRKVTTTS